MHTLRDGYFTAYSNLKLTRDADGVLIVQFHNNARPLTFTAMAHTEVVRGFYRISQVGDGYPAQRVDVGDSSQPSIWP